MFKIQVSLDLRKKSQIQTTFETKPCLKKYKHPLRIALSLS